MLRAGASAAVLAAAARAAADAYGAKFGVLVGAADWAAESGGDLALAAWRAFVGRWLAAARAAQRGEQARAGGFVSKWMGCSVAGSRFMIRNEQDAGFGCMNCWRSL